MTTITISGLNNGAEGVVNDNIRIASETSTGVTQFVYASSLKTYMTTLPTLTVSGQLNATLHTPAQPSITSLGTLTGLTTSGQITSTLATGTAPLSVASSTLVPNLYAARALIADAATDGLTTASTFANIAGSDVIVTGSNGSLTTTLRTVNSTPGTWGGAVGGVDYYIPSFTLNSKGLVTSVSNVGISLNFLSTAVTSLTGTPNEIDVSSYQGDVTLSLPNAITVGNITSSYVTVENNVSAGALFDNGKRVVTGVTCTAGTGITLSSQTTVGPSAAVTITNSGVTSIIAGSGITISGSTGAVTITAPSTGVSSVTASSGITANVTAGNVGLSISSGYNGYGARTVSTSAPSGGNDGDIWYRV
jgi:hypothetical protein